MSKKVLLSLALITALALVTGSAFAQSPAIRSIGRGVSTHSDGVGAAPAYCHPCLFYGGDWNSASTDWVLFATGNVPTFGGPIDFFSSFAVPANKTWTVTGLFANVGFININKLDPTKTLWSINRGMKAGNKGTVVSHGMANAAIKATGRTADSGAGPVVEYTVRVAGLHVPALKHALYFEEVQPNCSNTSDQACGSALFYESDTFDDTETKQGANHFGPPQAKGQNFQNSAAFGYNYQQINEAYCSNFGFPAIACDWISAGVIGTAQ
jgi:hypothetical protein